MLLFRTLAAGREVCSPHSIPTVSSMVQDLWALDLHVEKELEGVHSTQQEHAPFMEHKHMHVLL